MTTATAAKKAPAARTPAKAVPPPAPAVPAQPPSRRRGFTPLTPMRRETAKRIRKLADQVQSSHPDMTVHDHLRDAARVLESGNEEGAQRHLRAAAFALSPQSLMRNGLHTDEHHTAARAVMHGVHRGLLLVKDIADADARNQAAIRRDSYGDDSSAPPMPRPADPNAGYGPGALAQKPTARQPGGDKALNAPAKADGGGSDPNAADPDGPRPRGSKQFSYGWDDVLRVIEMTGDARHRHIPGSPYDYRHNYVPLTHAAASSHFKGSIPKSWHPASGGGKAEKALHPVGAGGLPKGHGVKAGDAVRGHHSVYGDFSGTVTRVHRNGNLIAAVHSSDRMGSREMTGVAVNRRDVTHAPSGAAGTVTREARPGESGGILSGAHPADRLTVASNPGATAKAMSVEDLKAADQEFARRAAALGKPGQVAKAHKAVRAELAARNAARPNTAVQPDPGTGELREVSQKETAEAMDRYARTFPAGSIDRGVWQQKALDVARGGPEWQHLKENSDPLRPLVTARPAPGAAPKATRAAAKAAPKRAAGNEKRLSLISERMGGADRTTGNMQAGDMLEGHQAISPAPAGIIGGASDPWWMAGPDGKFALSVKTASGKRQLIPWSAQKQAETEAAAVKAATQHNRYGASYGSGFQNTLAKAVASRQHYEQLGFARSWDDLALVITLATGDNCYRCSTPNAPDARHCKRCGFGMEPRQAYDRFAAEDITCPFCGRGDEAGSTFCDQCGKRLPETPFAAFANRGRAISLSAQTAALERTPAPYGKPGGPGLYGVAGQRHSDYFEQLVRAFMTKRGMDKAGASRMAWGALKRWARGGGGVHPEVRAAAAKALAEEEAKAKTAHSHAVSWDDVARDIRLSTVLEFFNPAQPRVPAGSATGGQFAAASGGQASQSKSGTAAKGKAPAAAPAKPTAHQLHVAHFAHVNKVSTKKAELMVTAQDDRQKAAGLIRQRNALEKALQSASGKTNSGQAGATTSANATTKTTAPSTSKASTSTTSAGASTTSTSAPGTSKTSTSTAAAAPKAGSAAAIKAQIATLNTQIGNLLAAAKQAETQAAAMR